MRPTRGPIGVVDVETTFLRHGERPRTKFWGLALENEPYRRFMTSRSLIDYLTRRADERLSLYHHHDFDVCQLMVDGIYPTALRVRGGRVIRSTIGGAQWTNSFALFPNKLADILASCGFTKKPLGLPSHELECDCSGCYRALQERNESDCVEALAAFEKISGVYASAVGLNPLRSGFATAAGCSFAAAERMAGPIPVDLSMREAYRGGRTEAFQLGDCGICESWDIASSYPFSFFDAPLKDRLIRARVNVEVGDQAPPFFLHEEGREKLIFPNGSFETFFFASNFERYYKPHGGIRKIEIISSTHTDLSWLHALRPLLRRAYDIRKQAKAAHDASMSYALKIFINSVYGRIAMRPDREIAKFRDELPGDKDVGWHELPDGRFLRFESHETNPRANYLLGAFITDNARARLYDQIRKTGAIYCDTDSVKIPIGGRSPDPRGVDLGQWTFETQAPLFINSVKDYFFDGVQKRKGGRGSMLWTVKRALSGKAVLEVTKHRKSVYDKREIYSDGSTTPLTIDA